MSPFFIIYGLTLQEKSFGVRLFLYVFGRYSYWENV